MLQAESPGDYVVATGEAHSVKELLDAAFAHLGLEWQKYVEVDPRYFRPSEVDHLCGDPSRARKALRETRGNRTNAAKILEISHRALLYKIKEYRIDDL